MRSPCAPLTIDDGVATAWAELVAGLRAKGRKAPINDSWIAAVAIANDFPLLSQDRDYEVMPNLELILL